MAHWLLTPIDHRADIWKIYLVQRIVVAASDERAARQQVRRYVPSAVDDPWLDPALTSCEEVGPGATQVPIHH
jgi:hypothetical protein